MLGIPVNFLYVLNLQHKRAAEQLISSKPQDNMSGWSEAEQKVQPLTWRVIRDRWLHHTAQNGHYQWLLCFHRNTCRHITAALINIHSSLQPLSRMHHVIWQVQYFRDFMHSNISNTPSIITDVDILMIKKMEVERNIICFWQSCCCTVTVDCWFLH